MLVCDLHGGFGLYSTCISQSRSASATPRMYTTIEKLLNEVRQLESLDWRNTNRDRHRGSDTNLHPPMHTCCRVQTVLHDVVKRTRLPRIRLLRMADNVLTFRYAKSVGITADYYARQAERCVCPMRYFLAASSRLRQMFFSRVLLSRVPGQTLDRRASACV